MKLGIVMVFISLMSASAKVPFEKSEVCPNLIERTQNPIEGTWKVVDFTYMKAGTSIPMELSRADFEDLVKHGATYTFDKDKGLTFSMGVYTQFYIYRIDNKQLEIFEKENPQSVNSYTMRISSNKIILTQKTDSYDLTLTLEKLN
jgi:hypothetical protein